MGYIILQRLWKRREICVERERVGYCGYEYGWKAEIKGLCLERDIGMLWTE